MTNSSSQLHAKDSFEDGNRQGHGCGGCEFILSSLADAVIAVDGIGKITFLNPAAEEITRWPATDAIGQQLETVFNLVNEPVRPPGEPSLSHVLREGAVVSLSAQAMLRIRDERKIAIEGRISPIKDAAGKILGAVIVFHDVTEKRRAEDSLSRSENLLSDFFENGAIGLHWVGADGTILRANRAELELLGYSHDEYVGHHISDFHVDDEVIEDILTKLSCGDCVTNYHARLRCKDGSIKHVLINSNVLWENGEFVHTRCFTRDITEQKFAEQSLRESEKRFAALVAASAQIVWLADANGAFVEPSESWKAFTGQSFEEMKGWGRLSVIHPDDHSSLLALWKHGKTTRSIISGDYRLRHVSGQWRWITMRAVPLLDASGGVRNWVGMHTDVDQQKRSAETQFRLAAIVESSDDAIVSKSLDGTITSWNRGAEQMFGYSANEAIGKNITILIPPHLIHEEHEIISRLKQGKKIDHFETVRRRQDGSLIEVSLTVSPLKDSLGNIVGASKIARDITERKRADEIRRRLAAIVESSDDAIISKTLDGTITSWNRGAERMYGYTEKEVIGKPVTLLIPPGLLDEEPKLVARLVKGEKIEHYETLRRRKDGTLLDVALTVSPIKDARCNIIGVSKIARDITERKNAQKELEWVKDQLELRVQERTSSLEETTKQLEAFCYTIAHDLRAPLRAQQSYAHLLLEDHRDILSESGKDYARRIIKSAQRLDQLVNDLLTYSRISRDKLAFTVVDLGVFINGILGHLDLDVRKAGAVVSMGPLLAVYAYKPTLEIVITNLISNALKFNRPGVPPQIHIWSELREKWIRLWVEDKGIGISPENLSKIFGVFQRLHNVEEYPGTGIGLAIVEKGVQRMGGTVGVESKIDQGSRFWIELLRPPF